MNGFDLLKEMYEILLKETGTKNYVERAGYCHHRNEKEFWHFLKNDHWPKWENKLCVEAIYSQISEDCTIENIVKELSKKERSNGNCIEFCYKNNPHYVTKRTFKRTINKLESLVENKIICPRYSIELGLVRVSFPNLIINNGKISANGGRVVSADFGDNSYLTANDLKKTLESISRVNDIFKKHKIHSKIRKYVKSSLNL